MFVPLHMDKKVRFLFVDMCKGTDFLRHTQIFLSLFFEERFRTFYQMSRISYQDELATIGLRRLRKLKIYTLC